MDKPSAQDAVSGQSVKKVETSVIGGGNCFSLEFVPWNDPNSRIRNDIGNIFAFWVRLPTASGAQEPDPVRERKIQPSRARQMIPGIPPRTSNECRTCRSTREKKALDLVVLGINPAAHQF